MKIPPQSIDSYIENQLSNVQALLFYGPDIGLVFERARRAALKIVPDSNDPFRVVEFEFATLKEEPALLADELAALSFGGGRRLIKVRDCGQTLPQALQEIISAPPGDGFMIFTAEELTPASTLRSFFEKSPNAAALACYKDEAHSLRHVIEQRLREAGYTIQPAAIEALQQSFAGDRLVILSELEKLIIYMGEEHSSITLEDVQASVGMSAEFSLDELCEAVAGVNQESLKRSLMLVQQEQVAPISILRALTRYFTRLHYVKGLLASGMPEQQAFNSLRPPVFFKQLPAFKQHVRMWNEAKIAKALEVLTKAELECKKTGSPAATICYQTLVMLPAYVGMGRK